MPRRPPRLGSRWWSLRILALGIITVVGLPILSILASWSGGPAPIWQHLRETVLTSLIFNSLSLMVSVGCGTLLLGVPLGWLMANFEFPGRRFFSWAALSPLAIPAYVLGFVYLGMLESYGPVGQFVTGTLGWSYRLEVRSGWGVAMVLILALYPYIYLISYNAFQTQGRKVLEVGRSLGRTPTQVFWSTALPMARPWIAGGLALVGMETLADFATVSIFVYDTLTTAIYKSWFGFFSPIGAAQLSTLLIALTLGLNLWEKRQNRRRAFYAMGSPHLQDARMPLSGWRRWSASAFCLGIILLGFVLPIIQLGIWAGAHWSGEVTMRTLEFTLNSLLLAGAVVMVVVSCALALVMARRFYPSLLVRAANVIAILGYALPGTVLAIGVFLPFSRLDHLWADAWVRWFGRDPGLIFTGTAAIMIVGLSLRFMAVGHATIASALQRLSPKLDEASVSLGVGGFKMVRRIHLPLLGSSLFTAAILVFIDVIKEMPLTLMTRPIGWDTLAVKIYEFTSEGDWQRASIPAILLSLAGLIPVAILSRQLRRNS